MLAKFVCSFLCVGDYWGLTQYSVVYWRFVKVVLRNLALFYVFKSVGFSKEATFAPYKV